ncbi:MAG: glycosyltransferase family 39 protein [Isosphaeraceae bacterium]
MNFGRRRLPAEDDAAGRSTVGPAPRPASWATLASLGVLLLVATVIRSWRLGRWSFWYDEVVTARLALTSSPLRLVELLGAIDATRAPLHPLLLQGWIGLFGATEAACRSLSVVCGVLTVYFVARIGRRLFRDPVTGLIAGALAAVSPALVIYARETRMYAWLVLLTCIAWDAALPADAGTVTPRRWWVYIAALVGLGYTHPLGLIMAATLAMATWIERGHLRGIRGTDGSLTTGGWFLIHVLAALPVLPWIPRYLDHPPESTVGVQPLRFLIGLPIGYIGGNSWVLPPLAALIAFGLLRRDSTRSRLALDRPAATWLLLWLSVPPVVLYVYSRLGQPLFGPERYTLFVAPAYLILVARGLARLPIAPRALTTSLLLGLAAISLPARAFPPDARADWRGATALIDRVDPSLKEPVLLVAPAVSAAPELATARYYLDPRRRLALADASDVPASQAEGRHVWCAVSLRQGQPVAPLPEWSRHGTTTDLPGLRLVRVKGGIPSTRNEVE